MGGTISRSFWEFARSNGSWLLDGGTWWKILGFLCREDIHHTHTRSQVTHAFFYTFSSEREEEFIPFGCVVWMALPLALGPRVVPTRKKRLHETCDVRHVVPKLENRTVDRWVKG